MNFDIALADNNKTLPLINRNDSLLPGLHMTDAKLHAILFADVIYKYTPCHLPQANAYIYVLSGGGQTGRDNGGGCGIVRDGERKKRVKRKEEGMSSFVWSEPCCAEVNLHSIDQQR